MIRGKRESIKVLATVYCINKKLKKHEIKSNDLMTFMKEHDLNVPKYPIYHFRKMQENCLLDLGRKRGRFKINENGIAYLQTQ